MRLNAFESTYSHTDAIDYNITQNPYHNNEFNQTKTTVGRYIYMGYFNIN